MTTKAQKPMPKAAREKTPDRLAVEDAIKAATRRGESCTIESLATRLDMTPKRVRTAVRNLMTVNMLVSTRAAGCAGQRQERANRRAAPVVKRASRAAHPHQRPRAHAHAAANDRQHRQGLAAKGVQRQHAQPGPVGTRTAGQP